MKVDVQGRIPDHIRDVLKIAVRRVLEQWKKQLKPGKV